jgi:ATP-dependent helicase IRC3
MPARPYQEAAEDAVIDALDNGCHQQIVSMATGTGKTWVFSDLYEKLKSRLPGQMLVLAHTEELIDQNIATMREVNPDIKVDKEMAKHKADPSTADVIIASVASLGRKGTSRIEKYNWDNWDKVIVDEAHHTPANSYRNVLDFAAVMRPDTKKLLLGVTATTQRADGKALADIYKKIVYVYSMRQAIHDGWLVDIKGYRVQTDTDISELKTSGGDFNQEELSDKIDNAQRNQQIVKAWIEKGQQRQTVVFAASIQHAKDLAERFVANGVTAEAIWGDDPGRAEKLKRHREGAMKVIVNCNVLTEGYDDPSIGCIVLARPTKSAVLFTQMCGRGTRLQAGTGNLKTVQDLGSDLTIKQDCIIIDVVDVTGEHSLCTIPTLMGLPGAMNMQGRSLIQSIEAIEHAQEQFPNIDFTKLKDIADMKSFIEQVNMFAVRFPEEVEANSNFKWYKAVDGGYGITIPKSGDFKAGSVRINSNMLGKWEIHGVIKDSSFFGIRPTMEEAFVAADNAIRERYDDPKKCLPRKASWHDKPVSIPQWQLLKKLYPYKTWPDDFTSGQASHFIDQKIGRKK